MANKYEEKKIYYIPAYVEKIREFGKCPVKVSFYMGEERCAVDFENSPGLLFTTEEVAENVDLIARSTLDEYSEKAQRKIEALTKQLEEANETIKAFSESEDIVRTNFDAKVDENRELKARNAELEALLKEVMATRDEAIKQNNELIAENKRLGEENLRLRNKAIERTTYADNLMKENEGLKGDCNEWKDAVDKRIIDIQTLTAERDNLKADLTTQKEVNEELKAWYEEANRTASEAAEANDELKAKIAELRDEVATLKAERCSLNGQVGKNLAEIQALSSDVHFFKEACKKQKAECDELKGRYDELDSVNKEQAEKIRKLDAERDKFAKTAKDKADLANKACDERNDAQGDLVTAKAAIDYLQEENKKLNNRNKYLESEKNRKPIVHVLTNDGHVYAFTSSGKASVKYHTELNILMIEDGEKTIAGFVRGDKPGNLSAWWTE